MNTQPRTQKGQATQAKLLQTALECFAAEGFRASSMRVIAARAGVSLSHAYYYFESKEEIVAQLLLNLRTEQFQRCIAHLDEGNTLESNIRVAYNAALEVMEPYHDFGPTFLKVLLSREALTAEISEIELSLWEKVVSGSRPLPPLGIRRDLPRFLWLLSGQVFSAWAYDNSKGRRRSRLLMKNTAPVVAKFAVLCRLPVVRSLFEDVLSLLDSSNDVHDEPASTAAKSATARAS
ncbi:TetR/AcrR family transcriptional regulator [Glutamicibacter sp.]|uniref:TetR/AcrR family transcriptional regulator n=1 Tax=Glutamicibacter sp. TaxID=1931995 RepID=UPI0028BEE404|nr:TetR/AcrR family transcriptional regulator [Glutamicibacter sp.]